jgi:integrase
MSRPRLLEQVRREIWLRHYSRRTKEAYVRWTHRFVLFHGKRHPAELGPREVSAFLTHLAAEENIAASTQNQALCALVFLYRHVLEQPFPELEQVVRAKRPARLPVVYTPEEMQRNLAKLEDVNRLVASLLYGAGLRLLECLRWSSALRFGSGEERTRRVGASGQPAKTDVSPLSTTLSGTIGKGLLARYLGSDASVP